MFDILEVVLLLLLRVIIVVVVIVAIPIAPTASIAASFAAPDPLSRRIAGRFRVTTDIGIGVHALSITFGSVR